jgi:hypothetical protein
MSSEIRDYLAAMPHFAMLPANELDQLAIQARPQVFAKGVHLAIQGKTRIFMLSSVVPLPFTMKRTIPVGRMDSFRMGNCLAALPYW